MTTPDSCCSLMPYFKVHEGKLEEFKHGCTAFIEKTKTEAGCLFYGFTFNDLDVHCREGYKDATALLFHLENVGPELDKALKISDITRLEIHGPAAEIDKLREPLAAIKPKFFVLEGESFRI